MAERRKLADMDILSGLADTDNMVLESGGSMRKAALSVFTDKIMGDMNADMITDNVMILFRDTTNGNYRSLAKLADWPSRQSNGQYAIGVVLMLPGYPLVVSVEAAPQLLCASAALSGLTLVPLLKNAERDMDGEANTAAMIAASGNTGICDTADYAPGYCNLYSRLDSNGLGIGAGHWWLPSLGELLVIYANYNVINYALSLISDGSPLTKAEYWSSTSAGQNTHSWRLNFSSGYVGTGARANYRLLSRPVTILQED